MSKLKDTDDPRSPEEILLVNIGHEVMNFRKGFPKTSLKHTFVLSQYGSGMFGLQPQKGVLYLGIPKSFYEKFRSARWLYAARVKGQAGLFLVMQIGSEGYEHPIGIRLFVRSRRLEAMDSDIKSLRAVPMDRSGITRENDLLQGFNLKFVEIDTYAWEQEAQERLRS
jgi:hypothetical protein